MSLGFEIPALIFFHISAAMAWVGAHFFEALILHVSLAKVPQRTKYEVYSNLLLRFNKSTGLAAVATLYFGIMLASTTRLGSLVPLLTTPWGLLSTLFAIFLLIGLLAPLPPKIVGRMFNLGLVTAMAAGVAALASVAFSLELGRIPSSRSGIAILLGALIAVLLLVIGATQGLKRIRIAHIAKEILAGQGGDELVERFETLEKKMLRMVIPENLVALAIVALMVYAANPF